MRQYTRARKAQLIDAWRGTCLSAAEFAKEYGISPDVFRRWVRAAGVKEDRHATAG